MPRFGSALSAIAVAGVVTGCSMSLSKQGAREARFEKSDVGLATRAHLALAAGDFQAAVNLAERAVENTPDDAALRAILGNSYFGAGRFASAETAYRDSISLVPAQPKIVLKLALAQVAQGKNGEALALLSAASDALEPADYGLAMALAGQPQEAVRVLELAARSVAADSRVRQNLAFAYGLSGDWMTARTIAAQDLPADQVASRIQQWMGMSQPRLASDQVAALTGITPSPVDPGQPVRLALRDSGERFAELVQSPAPQSAAPQPMMAAAAPPPLPPMAAYVPSAMENVVAAARPAETTAPVAMQPEVRDYRAPALAAAFEAPAVETVVAAAAPAPAIVAPAAPPSMMAALSPNIRSAKARPAAAAKKAAAAPRSNFARKSGNESGIVVQLGAYSAPERVEKAWEMAVGKYSGLRDYVPASATFAAQKGLVYRLSVKGFANYSEANRLCSELRQQGRACFVRRTAGDSAERFAAL